MSSPISSRAFNHTVTTAASRAAVWMLWIDTESWSRWDSGLRSASTPARILTENARGEIVSLSGQRARFKVTEWQDRMAYAFETELPFAKLTVRRSFDTEAGTRFTHAVSFSGPFAAIWARVLGRNFCRALPPTMERLARLAEAHAS